MCDPQIEEPSPEDIEKWHAKYVAEVQRLFDTYKQFNPDYQDKTLTIIDDAKK